MSRTLAFAIVLALAAASGCEQRFSAAPPPLPPGSIPPASSSGGIDALLGPSTDAGAVLDVHHALTVTLCSASPQACPAAETGATTDASYLVVFGSGRGVVRSRGQAMADLYKELRDRTGSGERLDAETRIPGDAGRPNGGGGGGGASKPGTDSSDPLSACAFQLLDLVDGVGEVTLDVVHGTGTTQCKVSLGGSGSRCLVKAPEREHPFGR
jgi:hypothetical protein